eukprot:TRINITY_DN15739_c0_g1_i1.p1 TRINITY_DN15739_c0_g1~~TRINITY_DN15739_c0_g1_i1.p1  ORF type:complete len:112 (+),score=24.91 TRINITY_DN15739_c0_g1_i1:213-548(+)
MTYDGDWIQIYSPEFLDNPGPVPLSDQLRRKGKHLIGINQDGVERYGETIDLLARQCQILSGKWMLKVNKEHVDAVWSTIVMEFEQGKMGKCSTAKVSTISTNEEASLWGF